MWEKHSLGRIAPPSHVQRVRVHIGTTCDEHEQVYSDWYRVDRVKTGEDELKFVRTKMPADPVYVP